MEVKKIESNHMIAKNAAQLMDAQKSSSINHTTLTHLGMKPHQRNNYK